MADYPGSDVKLRFESEGAWPVEIELGWDGDDLVVWIFMDTDDADTDAEFGIGGFQLTGVNVRARANFQLTEAQATELRDALTKLLVPVQACD